MSQDEANQYKNATELKLAAMFCDRRWKPLFGALHMRMFSHYPSGTSMCTVVGVFRPQEGDSA